MQVISPLFSNSSIFFPHLWLQFNCIFICLALCGEVETVKQHLHKGTNVNAYDSGGYAPLHYAARKGHIDIARLLLRNGGDINIRTRAGKATPLLRAAYSGKEDMCRFLVENGADVKALDDDGQSVVHRGLSSGNSSLVKYFLSIAPELETLPDKRGQAPSEIFNRDDTLLTDPQE